VSSSRKLLLTSRLALSELLLTLLMSRAILMPPKSIPLQCNLVKNCAFRKLWLQLGKVLQLWLEIQPELLPLAKAKLTHF